MNDGLAHEAVQAWAHPRMCTYAVAATTVWVDRVRSYHRGSKRARFYNSIQRRFLASADGFRRHPGARVRFPTQLKRDCTPVDPHPKRVPSRKNPRMHLPIYIYKPILPTGAELPCPQSVSYLPLVSCPYCFLTPPHIPRRP